MDLEHLQQRVNRAVAIASVTGIAGGLAGGINAAWKGQLHVGWPIVRPAGLFAFFGASSYAFREMMSMARQREDPLNTTAGVGWTSLFFGRALTGRPWTAVFPTALAIGTIAGGLEWLIPAGMDRPSASLMDTGAVDGKNWVQRRWEHLKMREARLRDLNEEIKRLSEGGDQ